MGSSNAAAARDHPFLQQVMRNPDMYETAPNRERVFQKALDLDENIKDLDQNLRGVQNQIY